MKKFIAVAVFLILILAGVVAYLNKAVLPVKIKALIVSALEKQTGKSVVLQSVEFNLFRGMVLRGLVISEGQKVILSAPQASCSIFILPVFKKQIIIPGISLKSPYIFLERRQDGSFNLQDLFGQGKPSGKKPYFSVSVFKISASSGMVVFEDNTLPGGFKKEVENIQFNLQLGLPVNLKFNFKGQIAGNPLAFVSAAGEYRILSNNLTAGVIIKNLSLKEFQAYYNNLGDLVSGLVNLQAQINFKDSLWQADIFAEGSGLVMVKDKIEAKLNSSLKGKIIYNLQTKEVVFDGLCDIGQADIAGLELLGDIKNLHGKFSFNQRSLVSDSLKAELLGFPFEVKLGIKDFNTPVLSIATDLNLSFLLKIAKEKFNFNLISSADGKASLSFKAHPDKKGDWALDGGLKIENASLKLDKQDSPVENIFLPIEFSRQGLNWENAKFRYQGADYQSSGKLTDFTSPGVVLKLFSEGLSLAADFNLSERKIKVNQFKGRYFDSQFSASGDIDNFDSANPLVNLNGNVNFELGDLEKLLDKRFPQVKSARPAGRLDAQFHLAGNLYNFKNCYLQANLASGNFSFYGLNMQGLALDFLMDQRMVKVPAVRVIFYDGVIEGSGFLNLDDSGFPYHLDLKAGGIKLEKLIADILPKNKKISGTLLGGLKLDGYASDINRLNGKGGFSVLEGNLWELNLLQGLGKLLFASDLGNIKFSECVSDFLVKDKFVYTDNLKLKSNIVNFSGPLKIGFDGSLEGALDVEILSDMVPLSGTFKDVTTAIIGQAGKFAVIKLSGTLNDPKYNFKPAVSNIIKGLTDVLFGNNLR